MFNTEKPTPDSWNFGELMDRLRRLIPFAFARYGDGEWKSILKKAPPSQTNCDGHHFFRDMGWQLEQTLVKRPPYLLGLQSFACRIYTGVMPWIESHGLSDLDWVDADTLHQASQNDELAPFLEVMASRRPLLIGPPHLAPLVQTLQAEHLEVPRRNCYLKLPETLAEATKRLERELRPVLICAGPPAKLLVFLLHQRFQKEATLIDCGSVLDPYAGVNSRVYHQDVIARLKERGKLPCCP